MLQKITQKMKRTSDVAIFEWTVGIIRPDFEENSCRIFNKLSDHWSPFGGKKRGEIFHDSSCLKEQRHFDDPNSTIGHM